MERGKQRMKRKTTKILCTVLVLVMLSGCGSKKTVEAPEIIEGAKEALPDMEETAKETFSETTEPAKEAYSGTTEPAEEAYSETAGTTEEAYSEAEEEYSPEDVEEENLENQQKAYTLEEIKELKARGITEWGEPLFAVKKGDSYYLLFDYMEPSLSGHMIGMGKIPNENKLFWDAEDTVSLSVNYAEGDEIIVFSEDNGGSISVSKIIDTEERYCLPYIFIKFDDGEIDMDDLDATSQGYDYIMASYVEGDSGIRTIEEYSGEEFVISGKCFVLEGGKNEEIELGGYMGTEYKTAKYKCNARYYELEPPTINGKKESENLKNNPALYNLSSDGYEKTKEGYAIVSNSETNPFESGLYYLHNTYARNIIIEVK